MTSEAKWHQRITDQYLHHLVRATFFELDGLLVMMTAYLDDSGTDTSCNVAVASAYVSSVEQWDLFCRGWKRANDEEKFEVFHMADFNCNAPPFDISEWKHRHRKERVLFRLINLAITRALHGFTAAIVKSDYENFLNGDQRLTKMCGKHHYTFVVRDVLRMIWNWKTRYYPEEKIQYVFDRVSKGRGEIMGTFDEFKDDPTNGLGFVAGGYGFHNKADMLPLQAADILAWHSYHHMVEIVVPKRHQTEARPAMHYLMRGVCATNFFDEVNLAPFKAECIATDYYKYMKV